MTDYQDKISEFLGYAHRVGAAGLTVCSSGNLSWRIDDDTVLVSGTHDPVPEDRKSVV